MSVTAPDNPDWDKLPGQPTVITAAADLFSNTTADLIVPTADQAIRLWTATLTGACNTTPRGGINLTLASAPVAVLAWMFVEPSSTVEPEKDASLFCNFGGIVLPRGVKVQAGSSPSIVLGLVAATYNFV